MTVKALIVDDERLARQELRLMLQEFSHISVIGEAKNLTDTIRYIECEQPDVVFLDIQLRHESGFDLFALIKPSFHLIFVTAFDQFALRAFEVNALDYLLKPVNPSRLKAAIDKIGKDLPGSNKATAKLQLDDQILLNEGVVSSFVKVDNISHILASGDYTEVFTTQKMGKGRARLVEKSLKEWQVRLPEQTFIRIHRSTIININQIATMQTLANRTMEIGLLNSQQVFAVSRRFTAKLKQQFQ